MTTTTTSISINHAEIITGSVAVLDGQADGHGNSDALLAQQSQANDRGKNEAANQGRTESELRAAARRHGYTLNELAALMGVNYSHLCSVSHW
ncbi:MAG: hypothetical protein OXN21_03930 [Chloroflexota bacterium]|nr:hypothetical protein [Chloroflexota bacterium]